MQKTNDITVKRSVIERKLEESGERQRLESYLRERLIESGWKDQLKEYCLKIIRKKGLEQINLEDLVEELLPKGRELVPNQVKEDLLDQIKVFLERDDDYKKLTGF